MTFIFWSDANTWHCREEVAKYGMDLDEMCLTDSTACEVWILSPRGNSIIKCTDSYKVKLIQTENTFYDHNRNMAEDALVFLSIERYFRLCVWGLEPSSPYFEPHVYCPVLNVPLVIIELMWWEMSGHCRTYNYLAQSHPQPLSLSPSTKPRALKLPEVLNGNNWIATFVQWLCQRVSDQCFLGCLRFSFSLGALSCVFMKRLGIEM